MDHINYIQKNVSDEIQKEDSSIRDFFHLERNIFAFQEVHVDKQAPRNDKNIYDSLVSLLKAKEYERNTLDNRKKRQCLYNFVCLSVQEVPTIEYFCDSNPPGIQEVDHIKYLNRFIINKKDDFHLVHFIHKKKLISFIDGLDSLHLWFVQKYTEIISEYKKMLLNSSSLLNIYLTEIRKALSFQIYYRLTYTYKISIEEPTKLTLGADSEGITMLIYIGIDNYEAVEICNSDEELMEYTKKKIKEYYLFEGSVVYATIDWSSWLKDDYIAIALVSLNLEVIYRKCGIEFKEEFDDFDYFKFALFEISLEDSGKLEYIMLKRYKNYPDEGTGIYMNKIIYSKNIFLEHFLEITKLSKYITWRAELA